MNRYIDKHFLYSLIIIGCGILLSLNANSHTYESMGIEVIHPWCKEGLKGDNSSANITISNETNKNIDLISIKSDDISHIMFIKHEKSVNKITIPSQGIRGEDDFSIMLHGVKRDLTKGNHINAILLFSSGMEMKIKFVIGQDTMLDEEDKSEDQHKHEHH